MSVLSRLQALLGRLTALAGSGDEEASTALAMEAGSLFTELCTVREDAHQWR